MIMMTLNSYSTLVSTRVFYSDTLAQIFNYCVCIRAFFLLICRSTLYIVDADPIRKFDLLNYLIDLCFVFKSRIS